MNKLAVLERPTARSLDVTPILADVRARADASRKARHLAPETVRALSERGLFRAFLPERLGGLALDPQDFFRVQIQLAEADMSAGWVAGIIACHAYQIALMDERAQLDVYETDPDTRVSSSYNPIGARVAEAPGRDGLMLSGRWGWSSGCDHCTWALLGGVVPGEGYRTFLVPRADYKIDDTWFSMGLQGTGSNDIVIDEPVFVPHYRTHKQMDGFNGVHSQEDPIYNISWAQIFIRIVSTPTIGAVKRALGLFMDNSAGSSSDPTKLRGDADITRRLAEVANMVDEAEAIMYRNFDRLVADARAGRPTPIADRVRYRYQASIVSEKMIRAIDLLFDVAGGRSVYEGSEIQKIWHDIHMTRAHVANNPVGFARNFGSVMLGGENGDFFV